MTDSSSRWLRIWIEALSAVGGFASLLSLRTHIQIATGQESAGAFCHISSKFDCAAVIGSEWSIFFGVPLASYGLVFYTGLFFLALLSGEGRVVLPKTAGRIFFLAGLLSSLASIALFIVAEMKIGALCLMCITMYLCNFLIFFRSWSLGAPEPFADRISGAVRSLLTAPGLLLGAGARSGTQVVFAWVTLLAGLPLAFLVMFPPVHLFAPEPLTGPPISRVTVANNLNGGSLEQDYFKGSLSAPLEIVEFADFECPGCRRMYLFLEEFLKEFEGKYRLVFRNFPLDNKCNSAIPKEFHKHACTAALYARCAGEQGKFWEALDYLFTTPELENPDGNSNVEKLLIETGSQTLGLDASALQECLDSKRHVAKIQMDAREAMRIGLQYTPSIWVNGRFVDKLSPETLRKMINEELEKASKQTTK